MKTNQRMRSGFTLVELLVVIAIIATLAGVGLPAIINQIKKGDRSEATMNAKQIGVALFNFNQDYGSFPSDATATDVQTNNPSSGMTFGTTNSNDYFRQLIASGHMDQEKPFYAKGAYTKKPDNVTTSSKALDKGECGFAYIMKSATESLSSASNSAIPLICASVYNGASDGTFDPDIYDKNAVILHIDSSVSVDKVRTTDKKVIVGGGKTLLDNGTDTIWGTDITPIIKPPLKSS